MAPRWTYSEANASRWRPLFDDLLGDTPSVEVLLEGNGKSLCSLHIRISDALKWLADQFKAGNAEMEPYARLKRRIRYSTPCACTSKGPTTTAPSRTLTPPSLNVYNLPCSDPT